MRRGGRKRTVRPSRAGASRCNGNAREVCSDGVNGKLWRVPMDSAAPMKMSSNVRPFNPAVSPVFRAALMVLAKHAPQMKDAQPCQGESRCEDNTGEAVCVECMEEWWADLDGDGIGDPENSRRACQQPDNHLPAGGDDRNDEDDEIYPGKESCDRIDNDCDNTVDEGRQQACGIGEFCENAVECRTATCDVEFNVCVTGNLIVIGGGTSTQGSTLKVSEAPAHRVHHATFSYPEARSHQCEWSEVFPNNPSPTPGKSARPKRWYDTLAYANARSEIEDVSQCYDLSGCEGPPGLDYTCANMAGGPTLIPGCKGYRLY